MRKNYERGKKQKGEPGLVMAVPSLAWVVVVSLRGREADPFSYQFECPDQLVMSAERGKKLLIILRLTFAGAFVSSFVFSLPLSLSLRIVFHVFRRASAIEKQGWNQGLSADDNRREGTEGHGNKEETVCRQTQVHLLSPTLYCQIKGTDAQLKDSAPCFC